MSRVLRRLSFWILVLPDTRRFRWDDLGIRLSSGRVLDLLAEGSSVASIAHDLEVSDQTIYNWRCQDRIDRGEQPGLTTAEGRADSCQEEDRRSGDRTEGRPACTQRSEAGGERKGGMRRSR